MKFLNPGLKKTLGFKLPVFLILTIFIFLFGCDNNNIQINKNKLLDLQGHRGARGVRPENTLPAFRYAIDQKMTSLELDSVVTGDQQLIIFHDTRMNGKLCLDAEGNPAKQVPINTLTVKQLKAYDCGTLINEDFPKQVPVPETRLITVQELFDYVDQFESKPGNKKGLQFNIELKFPKNSNSNDLEKSAGLMVRTIEDAGLVDRVIVQSFVIDVLPVVKKLNPAIKTSALFQPTKSQGIRLYSGFSANSDEILKKAIAAKADIISPYYFYIKPDFVAAAHTSGLKVLPWTVNDEDTMIKMMNLNVDGIISDYPALLYKTYKNWQQTSEY